MDTSSTKLYGPKAGGSWPGVGTSLIGPAGSLAAILLYVGLSAVSAHYASSGNIDAFGVIKTAGSVITF